MKKTTSVLAIVTAAMLSLSMHLAADHHEEGKLTISTIMKNAHKGKTSIVAKVREGTNTEAELKQLIGYYLALEKLEPPKGSMADWKKKTAGLTKAAIYVFAEKDGAMEMLKEAANCKACHDNHRED